MKIATVLGARPQFIKAAPVSRAFKAYCTDHPDRPVREIIIHTGQHYDDEMSAVFFREMSLPEPDYHLGVASGSHGLQTGQMMMRIEEVLLNEKPDGVLVYGDTNSTLAGALAAAKLNISLAHVEAGLRSYNRLMPEEINRIVVDHVSSLLLCPSRAAIDNLNKEGISNGVHLIGDVMADALSIFSALTDVYSDIHSRLGLTKGAYLLATVHRAENTDNPERLRRILSAFGRVDETIILPLHPRTKAVMTSLNLQKPENVRIFKPVGYLDMIALEKSARMILTDSGGIQKEAYWIGIPCVTLRDETEWVETVESGWNQLVGAEEDKIVHAIRSFAKPESRPGLYGEGRAADRAVRLIVEAFPPGN